MDYELRLEALKIAREFTPHGNAEQLLENAQMIERHLKGDVAVVANKVSFKPGIDFDGVLAPKRSYFVYKPGEENWSGTAQDVVKLFNGGSTLICKARQIGMTTLLTNYAAHKSKLGHSILWFSPTMQMVSSANNMIREADGRVKNIDFHSLNSISEEMLLAKRGRDDYDYVIVDGLGFLPYANETVFMTGVMSLGKTFIFASEPTQSRGLFYDMWDNSHSFQKVMLTWHTPLYEAPQRDLKDDLDRRNQMDPDIYRSSFECKFRPVKE
jgi:hypothetical protein